MFVKFGGKGCLRKTPMYFCLIIECPPLTLSSVTVLCTLLNEKVSVIEYYTVVSLYIRIHMYVRTYVCISMFVQYDLIPFSTTYFYALRTNLH